MQEVISSVRAQLDIPVIYPCLSKHERWLLLVSPIGKDNTLTRDGYERDDGGVGK